MMRFAPRLRLLLAIAVASLVLGAVVVTVLPMIVRSVAVDRLARLTGRPVALEDVDLNLFTGRVVLRKFRLGQKTGPDAALEFARLEVRLGYLGLVRGEIRVHELTLDAPALRVTRTGSGGFDFDDLLGLIPPAGPTQPKPAPAPPRVVSVGALAVRGLTLVARDAAVTPAADWRVEGFSLEARNLTTRAGAAPGRVTAALRLNGAPIALRDGAVGLTPLRVSGRVTIEGFDLSLARPYMPETVLALPAAGRLSLGLALAVERGEAALTRLAASGEVALEGFRAVRREATEPFLTLPKLAVAIREADLVKRAVTLGSVEVAGLDLRVTRDAEGRLDALNLVRAGRAIAAPAPEAPPAGAPAAPPLAVALETVALRGARVAFIDQTLTPAATLTVSDLTAVVGDVTWPNTRPLSFDVAFALPTSGRVTAKGLGTVQPLDVEIASAMRDGALSPYQPYLPVKARLDARVSAESRSRISTRDGRFTVRSKGKSAIDGLVVRDPDAAADTRPPVKIERIEIAGLDFAWPGFAKVETLTVTKPELALERNRQGAINLRELFGAPGTAAPPAPAQAAAAPAPETGAKPFENPLNAVRLPLALDIGVLALVDGYARFLDRSTEPGFSETLERLNVKIEGFSSAPGKRAKVDVRAVVGGAATLSVAGEAAPFGDLYADLTVELRDYTLASVNPYADPAIAWIIRQGKLQAKFHYLIDKDQITATNDVVLGRLEMRRSRESDEVKRRLGLPLGLIISLIKNSDGDIKINVPLSGSLSDPKFDLNETIWTAVKNVLVNVLAAPFRAIGRLFSGGGGEKLEEPRINPVAFGPGSAALTDEMHKHLTQVANFLRRSPYVTLDLIPVATPRDAAALRAQALTLRLEALQREKKLKEFNEAVALAFRETFPGVAAPPSPDAQLARLLEAEPSAEARMPELLARRMAAVRDALVKGEEVPAARLVSRDPVPAKGADEAARVELRLAEPPPE
jgi:hypothetical protein